ncbi:phage minor tail protein L [Metapseudomonas otitidis]|uniref:phage minor tail protein L n=1 Tax=Metapseudomonas otitidis TaxID=319939 RepID=UPI002541D383|nr:phage minor tail protein L [Pseudomonas otitidis]WIF69758.1 phage minor tail protein L [Pseudomonas otitidis]
MIRRDFQTLEPGSLVQLFEVDCTAFGGDVLRFHGHSIALREEDIDTLVNPLYAGSLRWYAGSTEVMAGKGTGQYVARSIWWQGQEYRAWPCQIEGLEANGSGSPSSPTLSVGNIDGSISAACLYFDDLLQAQVTMRQTLAHYLDGRNFDGGNPQADPSQEVIEIWYVDRKSSETNEVVQWELSSPADLQGQVIPARIISGVCEWCVRGRYRGPECGYTGTAMFDEDGQPTDDPEKDKCSGLLATGCKVRWGEHNELPFGGFPGASLLRSN